MKTKNVSLKELAVVTSKEVIMANIPGVLALSLEFSRCLKGTHID